jgi:hypothetical protein
LRYFFLYHIGHIVHIGHLAMCFYDSYVHYVVKKTFI